MSMEFVGPYQIPAIKGDEQVARVPNSNTLAVAINMGFEQVKEEAVATSGEHTDMEIKLRTVPAEAFWEDTFSVRFDDGEPFIEADEERGIFSKVTLPGNSVEPGSTTFARELSDDQGWLFAILYEDGEVAFGQRADGSWFPDSLGGGGTVRQLNPVVIRGDSLTADWAARTGGLSSALGRTVTALGNGGHRSYWIAARQGGEPFRISVDGGALPASGPAAVTVAYRELVGGTQENAMPLGTHQGSLGGVAGALSVTGSGVGTFTRSNPGRVIPIPDDTLFTTGLDTRDHWHIVWAGRNNFKSANDGDQIVRDVRAMLDWATDEDHALVLSIPPWAGEEIGTGVRGTLDSVNGMLRDNFPGQFVDTAAMLRSEAIIEAVGLTPTATDQANIADGLTPGSLRTDAGHLNAKGYEALNIIIAEIYAARGWTEN